MPHPSRTFCLQLGRLQLDLAGKTRQNSASTQRVASHRALLGRRPGPAHLGSYIGTVSRLLWLLAFCSLTLLLPQSYIWAETDRSTVRQAPRPATSAQKYSFRMQFEPNVGQADQQVKFLSRGPDYTLFLTSTQAVLALNPVKHANPHDRNPTAPRAGHRTGATP